MAREQVIFERTVQEALRRAKLLFVPRAGNQSTSGNASSTQAGLVPPVPADATKYLSGSAPPAFQRVIDSDLLLSDVTSNNVSTAKHGFAPKGPNDPTKYLDGTGAYSTPGVAAPIYPFTSATGLMFRYNTSLSQTDLTSLGYAKEIHDISGNARNSDVNTTNPPKWVDGLFLGRFPALFFNFNMKLMISAMPGLASPLACTIVFVGSHFQSSGNSHIYNWAGNPIGFGSSSPLDFMFNGGTLSGAHPMSAESQAHLAMASPWRHPIIGIHSYNGSSSVQSLNNNEATPVMATGATGATNFFTIGSDSSTGTGGATAQSCQMALAEIAVLNFAANATQRAALLAYYKAFYGMSTP